MTKIIIKPKCLSGEKVPVEQIITLPHPRTQMPVRYLIQKTQLLQVIKVNDSYKKRSWFVGNSIVKDGTLYLATPFDLIFLTIPILEKACSKTQESLGKYLPMEDILEFFSEYHFPILISSLSHQIKQAIRSICQKLDFSRPFFRFDETLLLKILHTKANKIASHLPKSIEFDTVIKYFMEDIEKKEQKDKNKIKELEKIIQLARLKTAIQFINSYLPAKYADLLFQSEDFTPLSSYLQKLHTQQAYTLFIHNTNRFTVDFYSKKRPNAISKVKKNKKKKQKNNTEIHKRINIKD